jgi:carboxylate-amine ligase
MKDLWWDIRPSPGYGTLELRFCDQPATLDEMTALTAFVHLLATWYRDNEAEWSSSHATLKKWIIRENKWRAARWGLEAEVVVDESGATRSLRDSTLALVDTLRPTAVELGCSAELEGVVDILSAGASCARQRRIVDAGGALTDVVRSLRRELATDRPGA